MGRHEKLHEYSVVVEGKVSKIVSFCKEEAEIYVKNFIESRLTHAVVQATEGLKNIKAYFSDTKTIKEQLIAKIDALQKGITDAKEPTKTEEGTEIPVSPEKLAALERANKILTDASNNIKNVKNGADFNKENINDTKTMIQDAIEDLMNNGIHSLTSKTEGTGDNATTTPISLTTEKRILNTGLNRLRKWQFDKFEEEFSVEIYTDGYHEYKYAKTVKELCSEINSMLKALGAKGRIDYTKYPPHTGKSSEVTRPRTESEQGKIVTGRPEVGDPGYYYVVTETMADGTTTKTTYRWINGKYVEWENVDPTSPVNIEEDIRAILTAANINCKRIDVDWQDKDYDEENDPFTYSED